MKALLLLLLLGELGKSAAAPKKCPAPALPNGVVTYSADGASATVSCAPGYTLRDRKGCSSKLKCVKKTGDPPTTTTTSTSPTTTPITTTTTTLTTTTTTSSTTTPAPTPGPMACNPLPGVSSNENGYVDCLAASPHVTTDAGRCVFAPQPGLSLPWCEAENFCRSIGGHLPIPLTQGDVDAIRSNLGVVAPWLGGYQDPASEAADSAGGSPADRMAGWNLVEGSEPFPHQLWQSPAPDDVGNAQDCLSILSNLNDVGCGTNKPFICGFLPA